MGNKTKYYKSRNSVKYAIQSLQIHNVVYCVENILLLNKYVFICFKEEFAMLFS